MATEMIKSDWPSKYISILSKASLDARNGAARAIMALIQMKMAGENKALKGMLDDFQGETIEERIDNALAQASDECDEQGVPFDESAISFLRSFLIDMGKTA